MNDKIFRGCFLEFSNKEVEEDFQKMKDEKFTYFNKWIMAFSLCSAIAVSIFQAFYYEKYNEYKIFQFNIITTYLAVFMYTIFLGFCICSKRIKLIRWMHYIHFYFQIFVIMAFRFAIFRIVNVSPILLFFQYFFEIIVRLVWVILFLHSFLESLILNTLSLATVWIVIPCLFPPENFKDEMINTLAYSCVLFSVMGIAFILERQQKLAFYFFWLADKKAKWLTNVFENLNSGFLSIKGGKISFINSFFLTQMKKLKTKTELASENEVSGHLGTNRQECIYYLGIFIF
jgi:hypothetical protein